MGRHVLQSLSNQYPPRLEHENNPRVKSMSSFESFKASKITYHYTPTLGSPDPKILLLDAQ